jgi:hypothetical protein
MWEQSPEEQITSTRWNKNLHQIMELNHDDI